MMAALGTGALATALSGGDLGKGLMAGLGAWGGAGLGSALANAGSSAVDIAATTGGDIGKAAVADAAQASPEFLGGAGSQFSEQVANPALYGQPQAARDMLRNLTPTADTSNAMLGSVTAPNAPAGGLDLGQPTTAFTGPKDYTGAAWDWAKKNPMTAAGMVASPFMAAMAPKPLKQMPVEKGGIAQFAYDQGYDPYGTGGRFYSPSYSQTGYTKLAAGGDVRYPQSQIPSNTYATPTQIPRPNEVVGAQDTSVNPFTGEENFAHGGIAALGSYSDGGRALRGPGDGMSDDIPATIEGKKPARLADGEFVLPADLVSHIGNGSTEAGTARLYKMMDRIRKARTGTTKQGRKINPDKFLPA